MTDPQAYWHRLKDNTLSKNTKRILRTKVPLSTPLVLVLISQTFFFLFIFYLKITCLPFYGFRDTLLTHYEFPLRLFSPRESTKIPSAGTLLSFLLLWPEHNTCDHTFLVSDTFLTGTVLWHYFISPSLFYNDGFPLEVAFATWETQKSWSWQFDVFNVAASTFVEGIYSHCS